MQAVSGDWKPVTLSVGKRGHGWRSNGCGSFSAARRSALPRKILPGISAVSAPRSSAGNGPKLRWEDEGAGWNLLAFDYIPGARHADYMPGSADLPAVVQVLNQLQQIPCPDLPLNQAEQRWAAYLDSKAARELLAGQTLLHTDFNPLNVLIGAGKPGSSTEPGPPAAPRSSIRPASCCG